MTITCDTPLSEILDSAKVIDAITAMNRKAQHNISSRMSILTATAQSGGGLDSSQIVDDQPIITSKVTEIIGRFTTVSENAIRITNSICEAGENKEIEELETLADKITKKIAEQNAAIEE